MLRHLDLTCTVSAVLCGSQCRAAAEASLCRCQQVFQKRQPLGPWLSRQKLLWRSGKLSKLRISQLRALGVDIECQTDVAGQPLGTLYRPPNSSEVSVLYS